MIVSDGVAIYHSGEIFTSGAAPPDSDVRALAQKLALASPSRVFDTDCLASVYSDSAASADRAAGMLAILISRISRDYIMLFRRERIQEIKWGGDPAKAVEQADNSVRLSPRKSFAAFASMTRGRSRPFTPQDRRIGEAIRQAMIEVSLRFSESTGDAQKQAVQRQELLIAEFEPSRSKHTVLDPRTDHPKRAIRFPTCLAMSALSMAGSRRWLGPMTRSPR